MAPKKIASALSSFKGLPHRAQILGRKSGVLFVNDSKATNSVAASKSLKSFQNIHWIVGGEQKDQGIEALMPVSDNVKGIYLIGSSENSFSLILGNIPHNKCQTLSNAFDLAFNNSKIGDTILLAPACASFDQFGSFEDRGNKFINLFKELK